MPAFVLALFVVLLILIFAGATLYLIVVQATDIRALAALLITGGIGGVFTARELWERFGPLGAGATKPNNTAPGTIDGYLNGRIRAFDTQDKLFVPLMNTTLIPPQYSTQADAREETFEDISRAFDFATHKRGFVLIGDPGAGKSTALSHLMLEAIAHYRKSSGVEPLPVWINLGLSANPINADDLLTYWWQQQCFLPGEPTMYLKNNGLILFFDGLNEMPLDTRDQRAAELKRFIAGYPDLPVVVTCRVRDYEDDEMLTLDLPVIRVQELDKPRIQAFIHKYGADASLWDAVRDDDARLRWARNPLNLTFLIGVYKETGAVPADLNALYRDFVLVTYKRYRQDRLTKRDVETPLLHLSLPKLENRLKNLAFQMIAQGKGTAADPRWVQRQAGRQALRDGINLGVLVRDKDEVRFYHQTLHGYFAVERLGKALKINNRLERFTKNPVALIRQIGDLDEAGAPAVEALIAVLADKDWRIRSRAAEALGNIKDLRAIESLITALADENNRVQDSATYALGKIKDPHAVESLIAALADENKRVRDTATYALGKIKDDRVVGPIISMLADKDNEVRRIAAEALGTMRDSRVVEPLIAALADDDEYLRREAAEALGTMRDSRVVEPLIAALADKDGSVRRIAAEALGTMKDSRAVEPLIAALADKDSSVRGIAAEALGTMSDSRAVEPLIASLTDTNSWVRTSAAEALGKIKDIRAVRSLKIALADNERLIQRSASSALRSIGTPEALAAVEAWESRQHYP